jgi:hypothetical protein
MQQASVQTEELVGFITRRKQHSTLPEATAGAHQGPSAAQAHGDSEAQPHQL